MPVHPTWLDIAVRLLLTVLAGGLIGYNRGATGNPAGLRTTILVGLAASVAMILSNLLMQTEISGQTGLRLDVARLALGVLSGVGFIAGGAILRRGDAITGVTTAATLWLITVIGLTFGAGQVALGIAGTVIGFLVIWGLKFAETRLRRDQRAKLRLVAADAQAALATLDRILPAPQFRLMVTEVKLLEGERTEIGCDLRWRALPHSDAPLDPIRRLQAEAGIVSVEWRRAPGSPAG